MKLRSTTLFARASAIAIASSLAVSLAACSGGNDPVRDATPTPAPTTSPTPEPTPTPTPTPSPTSSPTPVATAFTLSGRIAAGIVINGVVEVRLASAAPTSAPLFTGRTDAFGRYTIAVPEGLGISENDLLVVSVRADADTQMKCDVSPSCVIGGETYNFGDTVPLGNDTNFGLSAVVTAPPADGAKVVNMTSLTTLVTELARRLGGDETVSAENLNTAASQVQNLFGFSSSNFSDFPVVDVTSDQENLSDLDSDAILAAVINSGLLGAAIEDGESVGLGLDNLNGDFVGQTGGEAGQFIGNEDGDDPAQVSLEDILRIALGTLNARQNLGVQDGEVAETVGGTVSADLATTQSQPPGERTNVKPSPTANAEPVEKAKALVADIKLIQAALEADASGTAFEEFAESIADAADLLGEDLEDHLVALLQGVMATGEAYGAFLEGEATTTFTSETYGVEVAITPIDATTERASFTITDGEIEGVTINSLTVSYEPDIDNESNSLVAILTGGGVLKLDADLANDAATLTIADGVLSGEGGELSVLQGNEEGELDFSLAEATLGGNVALAQIGGEQFAFDGVLNVDLLGLVSNVDEVVHFANLDRFPFGSVDDQTQVVVSNLSGEISAAGFAAAGNLSVSGETLAVTIQADAAGDNIQILTEPAAIEDFLSYEQSSEGVLTWTLPNGQVITADVVTPEEYEAEFGAFAERDVLGRTEVFDSSGVKALAWGDEETTQALRVTGNLFGFPEQLIWFIDPRVFAANTSYTNDDADFLANPPADVGAFLNGFLRTPITTVICEDDQLIKIDAFEFSGTSGSGDGFVLAEDVFCDSVIASEVLTVISDPTFNEDLDFTINFNGALREDIVAVDPQDPEVEFSIAGSSDIGYDAFSGSGALTISFAGRQLTSNTFSLDLENGLNADSIVITNQDNAVLTLQLNEEDELFGDIKVDGELVAEIGNDFQGLPSVTYSDQTGESLFD